MRLKTYTAPDMQAALRLIRDELGQQALILGTRKVKSADGKPSLEITAALNEPDTPLTSVTLPPQPEEPMSGPIPPSILPPGTRPTAMPRPQPSPQHAANIQAIAKAFQPPAPNPQPATLQPHPSEAQPSALEQALHAHRLAPQLIGRIVSGTQGLTAAQFASADALEMILQKIIPFTPLDDLLTATHAHAFVGPHGAGKTSFIIRLAQQWKKSGAKILIFSLDDHKLAGFEPLARAAEILGIPATLVGTPDELARFAPHLSPGLRLLIDTPGVAPADRQSQHRLRKRLDALGLPLHTHLLLPAAWHGPDLPQMPAAYQALQATRLLPTRLDEAFTFGPLAATLSGYRMLTGLATGSPQLNIPAQPLTARWLAETLLKMPNQPWPTERES